MTTITIKNVGSVKEVNLLLNKINVFMGPQSSGKSTIAKIISYCTWVEKDVAISQSFDEYTKNPNYFKENLEKFHKLKGYFKSDSYILFESDIIKLEYNSGVFSINWKNKYAYKRSKISYIPSERNMAILPEVRKVEFGHTNIRSFLFDWFDARKSYSKKIKMPILDLNVDYYYSDNSDEDHIVGKQNGDYYDILLSNASSGLQSVTPLLVMIDYLTDWFYNQEEQKSFIQEEKKREVSIKLIVEKIYHPYFGDNNKSLMEKYQDITSLINENGTTNEQLAQLLKSWNEILKSLFTTQNSQFIIEEPEQNLFPETQRDLVYFLLEKLQSEKEHRLTFTTHSPYILYALNNCMLGGLVKEQIKDEKLREEFVSNDFLSKKAWINPQLVSIWEIENGKINGIQDKDNIISENYFDKKMTELTDEYYQMLNYYDNEE